jgi:hypothetical protein
MVLHCDKVYFVAVPSSLLMNILTQEVYLVIQKVDYMNYDINDDVNVLVLVLKFWMAHFFQVINLIGI